MNNNFIQITYLSVLKRIDLKLIARLTQLKMNREKTFQLVLSHIIIMENLTRQYFA